LPFCAPVLPGTFDVADTSWEPTMKFEDHATQDGDGYGVAFNV
jgi:hypothetical protein